LDNIRNFNGASVVAIRRWAWFGGMITAVLGLMSQNCLPSSSRPLPLSI
jgi:hypothetical protein